MRYLEFLEAFGRPLGRGAWNLIRIWIIKCGPTIAFPSPAKDGHQPNFFLINVKDVNPSSMSHAGVLAYWILRLLNKWNNQPLQYYVERN